LDNLIDFDQQLFLFLNGLGSQSYDGFWMLITNKATNFIVYIFFVCYYLSKTNFKSLVTLLAVLGILILFTDQGTNLFKDTFQRLRPCHEPKLEGLVRLVKSGCGGFYGYFSGHSSNSFALAVFFSNLLFGYNKLFTFFFITLAGLIAYSRIYIGVHYPLDVLSGITFGTIMGYFIYFLWNKYVQSLSWMQE
jgi:undecaprenyl-diphosphatase